ncbi:methyltransferase [Aliarcobacter butzleri 7h1h]|uniref:class I SAM-dependent methyltransferase n=1 Tax=Aliarcobacter butzleri TaxID=28197 RepID=UPI000313F8FD|nr:class I SAM-dependent methyltransferase [Aliarcobacter butzleri]AGR78448.1 methyltransferase [Aliarcobacter butzleri 7h1h]
MNYKTIIQHYEMCLDKYGDTAKGVDWTKEEQVEIRYKIMIELINYREKSFSTDINTQKVLDYGCGLSHLYEYIIKKNLTYVDYSGLEISEKFFEESRKKFPNNRYIKGDILENNNILMDNYDYIIMNGVFTEKRELTYKDMFIYFEQMIEIIYSYCNKGMAFNVMSKQVDWEIDYLFHVPMDDMANFLTKKISRNFIIRNDYGLYEYTVYLYK